MNAVQELYQLFYENQWKATHYTREKAHHSMGDFWAVLISGGLKFEKFDLEDVRAIADQEYRIWYGPDERHYYLAVRESNISFCIAYEQYRGRKPFIFRDINYGYGRYYRTLTCYSAGRKQGRLVIGATFPWMGETVTVTSFNDKRHALIACAYRSKTDPVDYRPAKIKKRYTITVAELQKAKKRHQEELTK